MSANFVTFTGNLGNEAKSGKTQSGKRWARVTMYLALRATPKEGGGWDTEQLRVSLSAWEHLADRLGKFEKGAHVMVTGRLRNTPIEYEGEDLDESAPGYIGIDLMSIELIGQLPKSESSSETSEAPRKRRVVKKAEPVPSDDDIPFV